MNVKFVSWISVLLILASGSGLVAQEKIVAVKAGQVVTMSGETLRDAVVLLHDGKIMAVGTDVNVPEDAIVIDASKKVVMPGLVNAAPINVVRGDLNEQSSEITPSFRVSSAIDPADGMLKRILQTGVTTQHVAPGSMNLIAGLSAVIKPQGKTVAEMMLKDDAALWISLGAASTYGNRTPRQGRPTNFHFRRPTTRMAVAWMVRKSLFDAQQYAAQEERTADPDLDVLVAAMKGQMPVVMRAQRSTDIQMALNIAKENDLGITLFQSTEAHKMAEEISQRDIPVILEPYLDFRVRGAGAEGSDIRWNNCAVLSQEGVDVALATSVPPPDSDLLMAALFAVRHGMSRDQALRAITLTPAEILGVADRVGSIDAGKDADLLVLSGDPVATTSRIERVIINGKTVYPPDRGVNK